MEHERSRVAAPSVSTARAPQAPRRSFAEVIARTAQEVVRVGASVAGLVVPGAPVLGAAVAAVAGAGAGAPGKSEAWDLLDAQRALAEDGQRFNAAYLRLQDALQRESREHNALSNIMKVRHDSAKAAINNIR